MKHIFRNETNHFKDTEENRKLVTEIANDWRNLKGKDDRGVAWYSRQEENGKQAWVSTRNGEVQNAGINSIKRIFNKRTGLNNPQKINNGKINSKSIKSSNENIMSKKNI